jgi:ABC-type uncharacterized transport system permease subunit
MDAVEQALTTGVEGGTVILLPALGELIGERAGVINLAQEGNMLCGALAGYVVAVNTGSSWLGVLAGAAAGAALALVHGFFVVKRDAEQLASGLVLWFFALGLTALLGASYVGRQIHPLPSTPIPVLSSVPWVGRILFHHDPLVYLSIALVPLIWWLLNRTRIGLVLRATGENPSVVEATGRNPARIRIYALAAGGALGGLGGAQLALGYVDSWFEDMTNGYGFIAVAVVLFAGWRPLLVMFGSWLFGIALAAAAVLQAHDVGINQYLLDSVPYLVTLIALVAFTRKGSTRAPAALGRSLFDTS